MFPRHPNHHRPVELVPRTWADAQSVAAQLCAKRPPDTVAPAVDESARQLVAALVLAATFTTRPVGEAVDTWLTIPGALDDTVRPLLDDASYTPGAHQDDARAAVAVLRHGDYDHGVRDAIVAHAQTLRGLPTGDADDRGVVLELLATERSVVVLSRTADGSSGWWAL